MMSTLKISKRPINIMAEQSHLTVTGNVAHEILGPTPVSSDGPTLLMQLSVIFAEFT